MKEFIKNFIKKINKKELVPITKTISSEKQFEGKVALISGGTGGIGLSIGKALVENGCKVIFAGTNESKLERIKNEFGDSVSTIKMNYAAPDEFDQVIKNASEMFGRIDLFINSAGVHTENVDFWSMNPNEFDRVIDINLKGTFFACQAIAKYMKGNSIKGSILLISSSRGSEPAWSPYGVSKWGLKGLTEGLAKMLLPYGIVVNTISPGSTATPLIGIHEGDSIESNENSASRLVMPDEVSELAKLLLSDSGRMIVGETIHISAGRGVFDIR